MARRSVGDDPHTQRPALFLHHQAYRPPHAGLAARLGRRLRKTSPWAARSRTRRWPTTGCLCCWTPPCATSWSSAPRCSGRSTSHDTSSPESKRFPSGANQATKPAPAITTGYFRSAANASRQTSPSFSTKPGHGLSRTGAFTASAARTSIRRPARPGSTTRQSDEVSPPIRPAGAPASGPCFPTSRSRRSSQGHSRASFPAGTVPACGNSLPYQPRNLPRESPLPDTSPDTPESLSPVSCLSIAPPE